MKFDNIVMGGGGGVSNKALPLCKSSNIFVKDCSFKEITFVAYNVQ